MDRMPGTKVVTRHSKVVYEGNIKAVSQLAWTVLNSNVVNFLYSLHVSLRIARSTFPVTSNCFYLRSGGSIPT